ncbi:hypothetical protein Hanom_Chr15g01374631 [Helianthus anomalus]
MTRPDLTRPDPIRTDFFTYIPRGLKLLKIFRTPIEKFLSPPLTLKYRTRYSFQIFDAFKGVRRQGLP